MTTARRLTDFVTAFTTATERLGVPPIFRRWTAISLLAATLEQKVWVRTNKPLYPNMYIFLIAHPGVGKTRTIHEGRDLIHQLGDIHLAPVSMTFASLVDALDLAKREIVHNPEGTIRYNSMYITADELGAFMHKYEPEMIDGLSAFYDPSPYEQTRRSMERKIKIERPQLNILAGSTPQNLLGFMPEKAWGQGFTSRIILVFSDKRIMIDDFAPNSATVVADLLNDLKSIATLYGEFTVTESFAKAVWDWRQMGEPPLPAHPKLTHYATRRRVHIYKLAMVASINRDNALILTEADFLTALEWLVDAETQMEDVFKAGAMNADAAAMDEIAHYVKVTDVGLGVSEQRIVHFARERIPITSILRIIEIMEGSGQIYCVRKDLRSGARFFATAKPQPAPTTNGSGVPDIMDAPSTLQ